MKTSELIGPALDWAVATAQGAILGEDGHGKVWLIDGACLGYLRSYHPSDDWEQGGPIIEREGCFPSRYFGCAENSSDKYQAGNGLVWMRGPSPLIAAMRCFVASKFGDEVEIPEELK